MPPAYPDRKASGARTSPCKYAVVVARRVRTTHHLRTSRKSRSMQCHPGVSRRSILITLLTAAVGLCEQVPGIVINHIPAQSQVYIGSPGIAVLPNGDYLAKHDEFGPKSTDTGSSRHAGLPVRRPRADMATRRHRQRHVLGQHLRAPGRRVPDGNQQEPRVDGDQPLPRRRRHVDEAQGQAVRGFCWTTRKYHCAPVPVVVHNGRIWRAMEDAMGPGGWGSHFRSFMMSTPTDSNLLDADKLDFEEPARPRSRLARSGISGAGSKATPS